jgi:hypothetical protein
MEGVRVLLIELIDCDVGFDKWVPFEDLNIPEVVRDYVGIDLVKVQKLNELLREHTREEIFMLSLVL